MILTAMTIEQMLNNEAKAYNENVWREKISSYAKYPKCQFYMIPADGAVYSYDRFFVTYQIPEGIILFSGFGYSSSLTNNAFCVVFLRENGSNVEVTTSEVTAGGKTGRVANAKEGRRFMAHQSKSFGTIFSSDI